MPSEKVLIVGAGVAGSVAAFWLAKSDYDVVVVERSPADQKLGQGIEIEEPAMRVVEAMGITDKLRAIRTAEEGFILNDQHSRSWAQFGVDSLGLTGALEMMRGDLTQVLYKAADEFPNVTYYFETTVQSITQETQEDKVTVELVNRKTKAVTKSEFDLVIGADGVKSRTRELVMGPPEKIDCYHPVGAVTAYFSIPKEDRDWPYARLVHFPGRRILWLRPTTSKSKETSVYMIHVAAAADRIPPAIQEANASYDRQKQKEALAALYADCGWETPRVLAHMMTSTNFYCEELTQVKLATWSTRRVALVGDAAWAPTNFTGQGNQLAIIGGWVLAQELARHRGDPAAAFKRYEERLRPYVTTSQNVPLYGYAPKIFVPETATGIWVLRAFFVLAAWLARIVIWTNVAALWPKSDPLSHPDFDLEITEKGNQAARTTRTAA